MSMPTPVAEEITKPWTIRLFGALEVERPDEKIIALHGKKTGEVLAWLALHPGAAFRREELAEKFWANSEAQNQRTRLRQEISALRTLFGAENDSPLEVSNTHLGLRADAFVTDAARFQTLLHSAQTAATPRIQADQLSAAAALYRAELLAEYPNAFAGERSQYLLCHEQALHRLAAAWHQAGETAAAKTTLTQLLTLNPLQEEAHADLMRLYAECGQPSEVRRQYQELERILQNEIGTKPTEATRQLRDYLLQSVLHAASKSLSVASLPTTKEQRQPEPTAPPAPHPITQQSVPQPTAQFNRASKRWSIGAFALVAVVVAFGLLNGRNEDKPQATVLLPKLAEPPTLRNTELWSYLDKPEQGELPDSEAKAMVVDGEGNACITGIIQTEKDDVDFLTVKLNAQGKIMARVRFSSSGGDCDRAYSIVPDTMGGFYTAGDSYFPPQKGVPEGWHHTLVHYDKNLKELWHRHSDGVIANRDEGVKVIADGKGGAIVAATEATDARKHRIALCHYDAKGRVLWKHSFLPQGTETIAFADITLLPDGNFVVCGLASAKSRRADGDTCWVTACFDTKRNRLWQKFCGKRGKNTPLGLDCDNFGNVFVFGGLASGDANLGTMRHFPTVAMYSKSGSEEYCASEPKFGGAGGIKGWCVGKIDGWVSFAGSRPMQTGYEVAFAGAVTDQGVRLWSQEYLPPSGFRSVRAIQVMSPNRDHRAIVAELSHQPSSLFHTASVIGIIWSDLDDRILAYSLFEPTPEFRGRGIVQSIAINNTAILVAGQVPVSLTNHPFTVVAFPRIEP